MITGQFPRREWKTNPGDRIRTLEEALTLAKGHGIVIPDEVEIYIDDAGELHRDFLACGPRVDKSPGQRVYWSDLIHPLTNRIPFRIWPGILSSDEAIIAVIAHEMHELLSLQPWLEGGGVSVTSSCTQSPAGAETFTMKRGMSPTCTLTE